MRNDNRIIVDLNKVQFAKFGYRSECGQYYRHTKPKSPTLYGRDINPNLLLFGAGGESVLSRALRLGYTDRWIPECKLQLSANHSLTYTGDKAISIYREFSRRIFKPTNRKGK